MMLRSGLLFSISSLQLLTPHQTCLSTMGPGGVILKSARCGEEEKEQMRPGRRAKPAGLRAEEGNRGHKGAITPDPLTPLERSELKPLAPLTPAEQKYWDRIIIKLPWLSFADLPTAMQFCIFSVKIFDERSAKVKDQHTYRQLCHVLGLDPSARAAKLPREKIGPNDKTPEPKGKLEMLIGKAA